LARARPEARSRPLLYGVRPVAEALRAGRRRLGLLRIRSGRGGSEVARIRARAEKLGLTVEEVAEPEFRRLAPEGALTQGLLLDAGPLPELSLDELVGAEPAGDGVLVALDGVEDPQNVGAIARVAEAAGSRGLVLTTRHAPPLGPAVSKASAGAIEVLPVARVNNLARALEELKGRGYWIFGADPDAREAIYDLPERVFRGPACLVLGAEGRGLRPGVRRRIDHPVRIPMAGRVASLNVSNAAAILLYEWVRRMAS